MSIEYKPICVNIMKDSNGILDNDGDYEISSSISLPRCDFAFQHWIHQNKNKASVLDQFEGKKKVYHVLNEFEINVDNYQDSIREKALEYFSFPKEMSKEDNDFFKMWEILNYFEVIDKKSKEFSSLSVSDPDSSTYLSIVEYRKKNASSKKDKYTVVGGHQNAGKVSSNIKTAKTVPSGKYDLVIMDKSVRVRPENIEEQGAYQTILQEIHDAISTQKSGGNLICKFYETFSLPSVKMIAILNDAYESVSFIKPLTSRMANSEKFAVCKGFKLNEKQRTSCLAKLKNVLDAMDSLENGLHVVDLFTDYFPSWDFKLSMIVLNKITSNEKIKNMDQILTYVGGANYHGDTYRVNKGKQIKASEFWVETFMSARSSGQISELLDRGCSFSKKQVEKFAKILIKSEITKSSEVKPKEKKEKKEKKSSKKSSKKTSKKDKNEKKKKTKKKK